MPVQDEAHRGTREASLAGLPIGNVVFLTPHSLHVGLQRETHVQRPRLVRAVTVLGFADGSQRALASTTVVAVDLYPSELAALYVWVVGLNVPADAVNS